MGFSDFFSDLNKLLLVAQSTDLLCLLTHVSENKSVELLGEQQKLHLWFEVSYSFFKLSC